MTLTIEFEIEFSLVPLLVLGPIGTLLYIWMLPFVLRHTDFADLARKHLRRYAPLYLVIGPAAMTYVALCGTLSAWICMAWVSLLTDGTREDIVQSGIFSMFRLTEWLCSFLGAYGFSWLLRWLAVPRFWMGILAISLSICAVYRTARLDPGPVFRTGPGFVSSPELFDAVPVACGLGLFAWRSRWRTMPQLRRAA